MARMPPPESTTHLAMMNGLVASRSDQDAVGISASLAGADCDRSLWYTLRWASRDTVDDGAKISTFDAGNDAETRLLDDLERITGIEVVRVDPATDRQFKVYALGGHVRGKLDAECHGVPEWPEEWHVVECKSINDRGFKEIVKGGVRAAKPKHFAQIQIYMHARMRRAGLYLLRHRDTCATYVEHVLYDPQFCDGLIARLHRIIRSNDAPSRIAEDPTKFPCVICQHKAVCHREAFARVTCRSCIHSTPAIGDDSNAPWACDKLGWLLDLDMQKRACALHRYIPAMVPGAQVDVEDDTVSYVLDSGRTWVDGQRQDVLTSRTVLP